MSYLKAYTVTWSSGLYTITFSDGSATFATSDLNFTAWSGNSTFFYVGGNGAQTLLDSSLCTSPVAATRALLSTAITALAYPGGVYVDLNSVQTLTNKTLTSPIINSISAPASAGTAFPNGLYVGTGGVVLDTVNRTTVTSQFYVSNGTPGGSTVVKFSRTGDVVQVEIPPFSITTGVGASIDILATEVATSDYLPAFGLVLGRVRIDDNGTKSDGLVYITAGGQLTFYKNISIANFTTGATTVQTLDYFTGSYIAA
jgi:hypothetical protein